MKAVYFDCSQGASAGMMLGALCAAQDGLRQEAAPEFFRMPGGARVRCLHMAQGGVIGRYVETEFPAAMDAHAGLSEAELVGFMRSVPFGAPAAAMADNVVDLLRDALESTRPATRHSFHGSNEHVTAEMACNIAALLLKLGELDIEAIFFSPVNAGGAETGNEHVPSNAVAKLNENGGMKLFITPGAGRLLTLDGAAILGALGECAQPDMDVLSEGVGYDGGTGGECRSMRAVIFEKPVKTGHGDDPAPETVMPEEKPCAPEDSGAAGGGDVPMIEKCEAAQPCAVSVANVARRENRVYVLECNIDDMSGEQLAYACEKIMAGGALDVWQTPIIMKKGRMASQVSVLCRAGDEDRLAEMVLRETSTLGVRMAAYERRVLTRSSKTVDTQFGEVRVKSAPGKAAPEFEDCKRAAQQHDVPIMDVYDAAKRAYGDGTKT